MKKFLLFIVSLTALYGTVNATDYVWTSAVPTEVHIIPDGLVVLGDFDRPGVECASGPKAIYLPQSDPGYDAKLSLTLTAKATGKKIEVLLGVPLATNCFTVSAHGQVPVAHPYYWRLKN